MTTASTLIGRVKFVARWLAGWLAVATAAATASASPYSVSSPFLTLATTPSSISPPPLARNSSSSSTLRCRSSLLRGLRCFTYVPNRCMYVYTPVRNNAGRATTLAHPPPAPANPPPPAPRALPSILRVPYQPLPIRILSADHPHPPVSPSPSSPWHRFYHPLPPNAHHQLVSFHALVLLSSLERASLSPVSTSVFLKCPIQSARRVRVP